MFDDYLLFIAKKCEIRMGEGQSYKNLTLFNAKYSEYTTVIGGEVGKTNSQEAHKGGWILTWGVRSRVGVRLVFRLFFSGT